MGNIKESVRVLTQSKPRDVLRAAIAEKEKRGAASRGLRPHLLAARLC
jgi:hypothetical protein